MYNSLMIYHKIYDPYTKKKIVVNSKEGKHLILKYIDFLKGGYRYSFYFKINIPYKYLLENKKKKKRFISEFRKNLQFNFPNHFKIFRFCSKTLF